MIDQIVMKKPMYIFVLVCLFVGSGTALAQESAQAAETTGKGFWQMIFDNALSITILFIFISAVIGTMLRKMAVDQCLRHFDDYHVTLELPNNELMWGTLKLYSTGLELMYREVRHYAELSPPESSYILYTSEYEKIQAIYRYHGDLDKEGRRKRERDIRKTYHPHIFFRLLRWLRNLMNTFKDAISQSLSLIIGQMKKVSPGSVILAHDSQLSKLSSEIIGYAGNAYDQILEKYIGSRVVVEITYTDRKQKHLGILKEYTSSFMELLNISYPFTIHLALKGPESTRMKITGIFVRHYEGVYRIENQSDAPVIVKELVTDEKVVNLHLEIAPGASAEVFQEDLGVHEVSVTLDTIRIVDAIVPRSKALVRHAGPKEVLNWKEILGFDDVEYFFERFTRDEHS